MPKLPALVLSQRNTHFFGTSDCFTTFGLNYVDLFDVNQQMPALVG